MLVDAVVLFFIFGMVIQFVKVDFSFPEQLSKSLMLVLLLAIGLKGGIALQEHASTTLIFQALIVVSIGIILPLFAFPLLQYFGGLDRSNSASIAAHYGSVSIGTFAVAISIIESQNINYEAYFPLFVVLLEIPAIAVGIYLARKQTSSKQSADEKDGKSKLLHEVLFNPGIILMLGGLIIGFISDNSINKIAPLFMDLFNGVLALFLLEMGMIAANKVTSLQKDSLFIIAFSIFMPLLGAVIGSATAHYLLAMSTGGIVLLATLSASASYIAVPAAMRVALPDANHGMPIAMSLGITFPFNVLVGIPIYVVLAQWLSN